ncbi:MAG: ATP synthase F1 subunit epsilon [Candidatus Dasytiphilus stammeri]
MKSAYLEVVSMEGCFFSGQVQKIIVTGSEGELGIYPGHAPLLTTVKPGMICICKLNYEKEIIYLSGGILEIQPNNFSVLADLAIHARDLDKKVVREKKDKIEQDLKIALNNKIINSQLYNLRLLLSQEIAKLRVINLINK